MGKKSEAKTDLEHYKEWGCDEDSQKGPTTYSLGKLGSFSWRFPASRIDAYPVKVLYLKDGLFQRDLLLVQSMSVLETRTSHFWLQNLPK